MTDAITIVGASLAGMHAARTVRRDGFDGRITVIDADGHLPYDKPPLSKQVLSGEWGPDRVTLPAVSEELDLDLRRACRAIALDVATRTVTLDDGDQVPADGVMVATGCAARRLPDQPDLPGVHLLRTLDDSLAVRAGLDAGPRRVVVIGAGFIGAEVAAACRGRGLEVTVVEVADVPLERVLGREMGLVCADLHREHGVDLRLATGVAAIEGDGRVERVVLSDGDIVDADVVVVGVGVTPTTGWLEGSGLTIDNGVVCDETLLAAPGVVAAGDIARWPSRRYGELLRVEHWENAVQMGEVAGRRLLTELGAGTGEPPAYDPLPWFWSDQYDRKIQLAGRSGPDDTVAVVHGSPDERRFVALYGRAGQAVGVLGMNRPRHVMALRQLLETGTSWDDALAFAEGLG